MNFFPNSLGGAVPVSWQGVNDLSAHPASTGPNTVVSNTAAAFAAQTVVLNSLGSLTNRENRFAAPRFTDDFLTITVNTTTGGVSYVNGADGFFDDLNGDKVPDLYPSLYPNLFQFIANTTNTSLPRLIFAPNFTVVPPSAAFLTFPYIFPGAYSYPQVLSNDQYGWIHSPTPVINDQGTNTYQFDTAALTYLQNINHNPLDLGDNNSIPDKNTTPTGFWSPPQTWWGFPTWRETLSVHWQDPTRQVNDNVSVASGGNFGQPNGLTPRPADTVPVAGDNQLLPWMSTPGTVSQSGPLPNGYDYSVVRRTPQLFSDVLGYRNNMSVFLGAGGVVDAVWSVSWEDDLVMTNVRSFDVKGYDSAFAGYADLGWADDLRLWLPYQNEQSFISPNGVPPALASTPPLTVWPPLSTVGSVYDTLNQTLAHEGRMPPIVNDNRFDYQFGNSTYAGFAYTGNVGDDTPGVVRMRRTWDSWSTTYSQAPAHALNTTTSFLAGPPYSPPAYPSYPPPYPAPLRGIQIQIRVADPTNQRIKSLTIRQDFTDKL